MAERYPADVVRNELVSSESRFPTTQLPHE